MTIARHWFGLEGRLSARGYRASCLALLVAKVVLDVLAVALFRGGVNSNSPLVYLTPSFFLRAPSSDHASPWLMVPMAVTTLGFLWSSTALTVRRAQDSGHSPWTGVLMFFPLINYAAMLSLCVARTLKIDGVTPEVERVEPRLRSLFAAFAVAMAFGVGGALLSTRAFETYGQTLFVATPLLMGTSAAWVANAREERSITDTCVIVAGSLVLTAGALLLFAIEGVICLMMAAPLAIGLAMPGAVLGWTIARATRASLRGLGFAAVALPLSAGLEARLETPMVREVVTSIEIDAPPEVVWRFVIGFSELPPPADWLLRLGIAYPMRARIEGSGVGAVRHCEFSTGPFVEPITIWEPPSRLAFDVESQPPSMSELSPYRALHAPHLEGYMVSRRGEFRLIALPDGRTKLEGTTWYTLALFPEAYWQLWSDPILHTIHRRVLGHIRALSEESVAAQKNIAGERKDRGSIP